MGMNAKAIVFRFPGTLLRAHTRTQKAASLFLHFGWPSDTCRQIKAQHDSFSHAAGSLIQEQSLGYLRGGPAQRIGDDGR